MDVGVVALTIGRSVVVKPLNVAADSPGAAELEPVLFATSGDGPWFWPEGDGALEFGAASVREREEGDSEEAG